MRVAAYVDSAIGFRGGGVILKDGFNIRGMNTAATLWCTAALGTLAGLGRFEFAVMGALGVLSANLILRPMTYRINRTPVQKEEHEILYRLRCACRTADEANIRTMLIQNVGRTPLALIALHSLDDELLARVNVKDYLKTIGAKEEALEQIVTRLSLKAGVGAIPRPKISICLSAALLKEKMWALLPDSICVCSSGTAHSTCRLE